MPHSTKRGTFSMPHIFRTDAKKLQGHSLPPGGRGTAERWKEPAQVTNSANYRNNALTNVNVLHHIFRMDAKKLQGHIASLWEAAKRARGVNDSLNGCQSPSGPSRSETGDRAGVPRKCLHFWGFAAKRWKEPAQAARSRKLSNQRTNKRQYACPRFSHGCEKASWSYSLPPGGSEAREGSE